MENEQLGFNWDEGEVKGDSLAELNTLVDGLFVLDKRKKEVEDFKKKLNGRIAEVEQQIYAILDANKLTSFKGSKGQVFFKHNTSAKLVDKDAFRAAVGEETWEGLASINSTTLNAWFKQQKLEAEEKGNYDFQLEGIAYSEFTKISKRKA